MKQEKKPRPLDRESCVLDELKILIPVAGLSGKDRFTLLAVVSGFNLLSPKDIGSLSFLGDAG